MSAQEEAERAREAIASAKARAAARRRLARELAGDAVTRRDLEERWAALWRPDPWGVEDDADLW